MIVKEAVQFRGVPFEYGDDILIVPPLPLGVSKDLQKKMAAIAIGIQEETKEESVARMDERIAIIIEAAGKALKRNYPDITEDTVQDFITQENMNDIFGASLYGSVPTNTAKTVGEGKTVLEKKRTPIQ